MHFQQIAGATLLALASLASADTIPFENILWGQEGPPTSLVKRQAATTTKAATSSTTSKVADSACTNAPLTRQCWTSGFSAATDFDAKWPTTGKVRTYSLEITNGTCNPDGHGLKPCQLFNGKYPGPVISADWGDTIKVTVTNKMQSNGTGIHWHGIRQLNNCPNDGVPGITECPLSPSDTKTYTFQATQHGTTWYHSHWSNQYGEGAYGPLIINGPASANYDIDLGSYFVNDWYYQSSYQVAIQAHINLQNRAGPPTPDTILVNGTNKNADGGGSYSKVSLKKGKKYRLRLINASVDNSIRVSLDGHQFQVVSSDLIPIKPYTTNWVLLAIGQRYDVIINANQAEGNYWFRAEAETNCASAANNPGRAVFTYDTVAVADPTTTAADKPNNCKDESPLVPWVPNTVGSADAFIKQAGNLQVNLAQEQVTTNGQNVVVWAVNLSAINVNWDKPTLQYVKEKNTSYPTTFNLIEIPNENVWSFWIIQETPGTPVPIPHPMHLHGHDFYVLGAGNGTFDINNTPRTLQYTNPPRRDTALLPAAGWLALAFPADNPGAWLMHCHIAWHVGEGLAVQFLEAKSQSPVGDANWDSTCAKWNTYDAGAYYKKSDSGL